MKNLHLVGLLRPQQWLKNLIVFLPVFFSGNLFDVACLKAAAGIFMTFCMMSSAVYCLNDLLDAEDDRRHPVKCKRPVAAGDISKRTALLMAGALALLSVTVSLYLPVNNPPATAALLTAYALLNAAYCLRLKRYAIVDVFTIASGFVLRLVAGGVGCSIWLSPWMVCLTFLLSLFLAFAKRRDDVLLSEQKGIIARPNIVRYNLPFLNQVLSIIGTATIVCYILYTVSPEVMERMDCEYVYTTSVFVLAGILRYLQITMVDLNSGSPTKILLKDRFIHCCLSGWGLLFAAIIYL